MINLRQNKILFPILFLLSWLSLTILIFILGPWEYKLTHQFVFYTYLLLINVSLFLGYLWGQRNIGHGTKIKVNYYSFVEVTIIMSALYLVIKLILTGGGDLRNFFVTFKNSSETYSTSSLRHVNLFSYLDIIFNPIFVLAFTNTIFSNNKLRIEYRICVYILMFISLANSIGAATRGGIVQIVILSFAAFALSIYQKNLIIKYYHKALMGFFILSAIIGFFIYSNLLVATRGGSFAINPITGEPPKEDYFLHKITPQNMHPLIDNTSFYVSHSYYQLNKALNLPFNGLGFGLTNSYFIMDNIEEITGWSGLKNMSYGMRLDKELGGTYGVYWSTFYTWIASDFTFPGTIIVIFFIGYLLSLALKDSLHSLNPLSVTAFCTLFHFIFHFTNNNPLQDGSGLTTYFGITALWLIFRKGKSSENTQISSD
jgi:hypothetical protein